jgi:hypothetical protein
LARGQDNVLRFATASGATTCRPLPPVSLAEAHETQIIEAVAHFARGFNDCRKRYVRARIEVEDKTTGNLRLPGLAIPGMELDSADLGDGAKAFYAVDLEIGLAVAENGHELQKIGCPGHRVALEELLSADTVGRSDD